MSVSIKEIWVLKNVIPGEMTKVQFGVQVVPSTHDFVFDSCSPSTFHYVCHEIHLNIMLCISSIYHLLHTNFM